jgi:ribose/xylose/arabinose/galactoside ABC-type transport system permease subunit
VIQTETIRKQLRSPIQAIEAGVARWPRVTLVYTALAMLVVSASVYSPRFRSMDNVLNILQESILLSLVSIGQTLVVLAGGIDLSVGSLVKLSTLIAALVINGHDGMIVPALLICVGLGTVVGLGNGLVITRMGVAPFVVTFAAFYILRGNAYALSTTPVGSDAPALDVFYNASVLGIPAVLLLWAFVWVVAWFALHFSAFGRHIYAIGGQQTVARLAGIKVDRIKIAVYVLCSVLAALGGLYELARITIGDPQVGEGLELDSITAVAIGGTSLFGGRGYIVGTFGGVLLLGVINNMFNLLQVNSFYQDLVKGIMILIAVAAYREKR